MTGEQLDEAYLRQIALAALSEDGAFDDVTTAALVPPDLTGKAVLLAKAAGVVAGLPVAAAVFHAVDPSLAVPTARRRGRASAAGRRPRGDRRARCRPSSAASASR